MQRNASRTDQAMTAIYAPKRAVITRRPNGFYRHPPVAKRLQF